MTPHSVEWFQLVMFQEIRNKGVHDTLWVSDGYAMRYSFVVNSCIVTIGTMICTVAVASDRWAIATRDIQTLIDGYAEALDIQKGLNMVPRLGGLKITEAIVDEDNRRNKNDYDS